jgi:drug/metabolite transporter (DMT)-like permease
LTFGRVLFGFLVVLAVLLVRGQRLPARGRVWLHVALVALLTNVIPFSLFGWAEQRVSSVLAGLFNAATPLFTAMFAVLTGVIRAAHAAARLGPCCRLRGSAARSGPLAGNLR